MTSEYTVTMIYLIFSWLLQGTKGFYNYCPIYGEANWIIIILSSNQILSIWSCLLFDRKPLNNWKTRSLGSYFTFCTVNKKTPLMFSKYITGNHLIRTRHSSCCDLKASSDSQNPGSLYRTFGNNCNQKPCCSNSYLKEPGHI